MTEEYLSPPEQMDPKGSYSFVSLGCPKNTVDSERMLGLLQLDGYQLVPEPESSDFVIVNTCGFIEQAREESFAAIDEMLELKKAGKIRGVIVSGWLAERQKEKLLEERPEIDSLLVGSTLPRLPIVCLAILRNSGRFSNRRRSAPFRTRTV